VTLYKTEYIYIRRKRRLSVVVVTSWSEKTSFRDRKSEEHYSHKLSQTAIGLKISSIRVRSVFVAARGRNADLRIRCIRGGISRFVNSECRTKHDEKSRSFDGKTSDGTKGKLSFAQRPLPVDTVASAT